MKFRKECPYCGSKNVKVVGNYSSDAGNNKNFDSGEKDMACNDCKMGWVE